MPETGRRHLSVREDVWRLLEEGARRRGYNRVIDYVAYLVNMDLAVMDLPRHAEALRAEYMYTVMAAGYIPFTVFVDLYTAAENAGTRPGEYRANEAYSACLSTIDDRYRRLPGLNDEKARKICMTIVDIQLSRAANQLTLQAIQSCEKGFRVVVEASRSTLRARAYYECERN